MYKKFSFLLLLLLMLVTTKSRGWERQDITQPYFKKPTTVLMYFVETDNSVPYLESVLQHMQKIGSNENVNILVYAVSMGDLGSSARALIVEQGETFQDGEVVNKKCDWAQTAIDACTWAHEKFSSDNFVLIFCNRGVRSFGSFCFMEQDLRSVLDYLVRVRVKPIDVVAFDVDLMATIEIACLLQPYADYLVASEAPIFGYRFPYTALVKYAAKWRSSFSAYKMVFDMVNEYENVHEKIIVDYTLSAIDLAKVLKLHNAFGAIANNLRYLLHSQDKTIIYQKLGESSDRDECTYFAQTTYADIGHFLNNLQVNLARARGANMPIFAQLKKDILAARRALSGCVVACAYGENYPNEMGLAFKYDCFYDSLRHT